MKAKYSNSILSIASWNVNGLEYKSHGMKCNKLDDPEVVNSLKTLDCIGLMETHADKNVDISLPGYVLEKIELNIKRPVNLLGELQCL